eukprot:gb/GECG01005196.1/.p1 GENE.gb/GECG01005196.1/~~gb/GECG01005196.1/.p1  ORF type:complete len:938 (+),score=140.88 gb/GECG01005196.1/:1-2814(+)
MSSHGPRGSLLDEAEEPSGERLEWQGKRRRSQKLSRRSAHVKSSFSGKVPSIQGDRPSSTSSSIANGYESDTTESSTINNDSTANTQSKLNSQQQHRAHGSIPRHFGTSSSATRLRRTYSNGYSSHFDLTDCANKPPPANNNLNRRGSRSTKASMVRLERRSFFEDEGSSHSGDSPTSVSPSGSCPTAFIFDGELGEQQSSVDEQQHQFWNYDEEVSRDGSSAEKPGNAEDEATDATSTDLTVPDLEGKIPKIDFKQFEGNEIVGGFALGHSIGAGGFGQVRLAKNLSSGEVCAIKFLPKKALNSAGDVERVLTEIQCMFQLHHPNILKLHSIMDESSFVGLVLEYAQGGDLKEFVAEQPTGHLETEVALLMFGQILRGVIYAHENHITHRDLKLQNVLLSSKGLCKLSDFGLSSFYQPGDKSRSTAGSLLYMAPELIAGCASEGPPLDVWSLGVMLYTMLVGSTPFEHVVNNTKYSVSGKGRFAHEAYRKALPRNMKDVTNRVRAAILRYDFSLPSHLPTEVCRLVEALMDPLPENRPSIGQLKSMRWLFDFPPGLSVKSLYELWRLPEIIRKKFTTTEGGNTYNNIESHLLKGLRKYWNKGTHFLSDSSDSEDNEQQNIEKDEKREDGTSKTVSATSSTTSTATSVNIIPGPLRSTRKGEKNALPPLQTPSLMSPKKRMSKIGSSPGVLSPSEREKIEYGRNNGSLEDEQSPSEGHKDASASQGQHSLARLRRQAREESAYVETAEQEKQDFNTRRRGAAGDLPPLGTSECSTPSSLTTPTPLPSKASTQYQRFFGKDSTKGSDSNSTGDTTIGRQGSDSETNEVHDRSGGKKLSDKPARVLSSPLAQHPSKGRFRQPQTAEGEKNNQDLEGHNQDELKPSRPESVPSKMGGNVSEANEPQSARRSTRRSSRRFSLPSPGSFRPTYLTHRRKSVY